MIALGDYATKEVLVPRIEIKRQDKQFIEWNRRQYPVRPAIAMTNNKIQCQTQKVVVWLEEPSFTHGHLYVYTEFNKINKIAHFYFAHRELMIQIVCSHTAATDRFLSILCCLPWLPKNKINEHKITIKSYI